MLTELHVIFCFCFSVSNPKGEKTRQSPSRVLFCFEERHGSLISVVKLASQNALKHLLLRLCPHMGGADHCSTGSTWGVLEMHFLGPLSDPLCEKLWVRPTHECFIYLFFSEEADAWAARGARKWRNQGQSLDPVSPRKEEAGKEIG